MANVFRKHTGLELLLIVEYNIKCVIGITIGFILYTQYPKLGDLLYWGLLSVALSISYDNNYRVAYERMKGNIAGSIIGLFCYFLHTPPNLLTVSLGVVMTIALCVSLKLINVARIAIVAFLVVVIYQGGHHGWQGALYRMSSVVAGCLVGLIIDYIFTILFRLMFGHLHWSNRIDQ